MNPTPARSDLVPRAFWPVMLGGFGVITLVIAYSILAMKRDRRRQVLAAEAALATRMSAAEHASGAEPERTRAGWEIDAALEEAPIGTVEYLPPEDDRAIDSIPEHLSDRRNLLRRS